MYEDALKMNFDDKLNEQKQMRVREATNIIIALIKKTERNIKRLSIVQNGFLSSQNEMFRQNLLRSAVTDLQGVTRSFKENRDEFLRTQSSKNNIKMPYELPDGPNDNDPDNSYQYNAQIMTQEEKKTLLEIQRLKQILIDREKEIDIIAQQVLDLSLIFKDVNDLIYEQGTIVDRIDVQIDNTLIKVKESNVDLEKAERSSRPAYSLKCICFLFLLLVIEVIILSVKYSHKNNA